MRGCGRSERQLAPVTTGAGRRRAWGAACCGCWCPGSCWRTRPVALPSWLSHRCCRTSLYQARHSLALSFKQIQAPCTSKKMCWCVLKIWTARMSCQSPCMLRCRRMAALWRRVEVGHLARAAAEDHPGRQRLCGHPEPAAAAEAAVAVLAVLPHLPVPALSAVACMHARLERTGPEVCRFLDNSIMYQREAFHGFWGAIPPPRSLREAVR